MGKTSLVLDILHELFVHQPNWKKCLYSLLLQFYCASSELSSRNLDFFCDIKTLHWLPLINIRSPILVKIKRFNFQINSICWMPMGGLWDITVRPNSKHEWLKSFFLAHPVEVCLFVSSSLLIDTKQQRKISRFRCISLFWQLQRSWAHQQGKPTKKWLLWALQK